MRRSKRLQSQLAAGSKASQSAIITPSQVPPIEAENDELDVASFTDVPDGKVEDIMKELHAALQADFKFDGHFYHAQSLPTAPNPNLNIEKIGTVGLPLSTRDAKAIIKIAKQAPFGHGTKTVVDKKVRNTWEVEPSQVQFENLEWTKFVEGPVKDTICKALGAANVASPPKVELYKLLLYETGSHFLPHQDTEKTDGMFATIIVLLPSRYTGGQVHVTGGFDTQVIDLSANSLSTSVMAWYADVVHEVKPIKSGYRLALAYNLIRTSSSVIPRPPTMDQAVLRLRHILRKWLKSTLKNQSHAQDFVTYLLKHQYNNLNLLSGFKALKGQDAHLVAHLRAAAKELGISVYLGALTYCLLGEADDNPYRLQQYGPDHQVEFHEIHERDLFLAHVVDHDGKLVVDPGDWQLEEENLIPKNPFKGLPPDEREYEGYLGNGGGTLQHWYRRTVILLVHKSHADAVFLGADGLRYVLSTLKKPDSVALSPEDEATMVSMVRRLEQPSWHADEKRLLESLMVHVLRWKSPRVWKEVILKFHPTTETLVNDEISSVMNIFKFEDMRPCFEELLRRPQTLSLRHAFISRIQSLFQSDPSIPEWCNEETSQALQDVAPTLQDLPILLDVAQRRGAAFMAEEVLPYMQMGPGSFDFMIKFIYSLYEKKASILPNHGSASNSDEWDNLIDECLIFAVDHWDPDASPLFDHDGRPQKSTTAKQKQLEQLFSYCLSLRRTQPLQRLVNHLVSLMTGDHASNYIALFAKLVPTIKAHCQRSSMDILSPPLPTFLRALVEAYLQHVLGPPPTNDLRKIRKIACTCHHCDILNRFVFDTTTTKWTGKVIAGTRRHYEPFLLGISDLVTFVHFTKPVSTSITKLPEIVAAQEWQNRAAAARQLLKTIGDDETIARLMGNRVVDIERTLQGTQAYTMSYMEGGNATGVVLLEKNVSGVSGPSTGEKRKRADGSSYVDCGVIDLT